MLRALPILWFILAALGAAAQLIVSAGFGTGDPLTAAYPMIAVASSALQGAIGAIAAALAYLLIQRTRPSLSVAIIGYSHLFLAAAARIGQAIGDLHRTRMLAGSATADYSVIGFAYTAAGLASLLADIVFILALVVALNTRTERPQDVF